MVEGTSQELSRIHHYRSPWEWPHEHPSIIYPGLCYWTAGGSERGHTFPVIYFKLREWHGRNYAEPIKSKETP